MIRKTLLAAPILFFSFWALSCADEEDRDFQPPPFSSASDLISLHYDHAPDQDDGHSAAADRSILETLYGTEWIKAHTVAVSGAYGRNKRFFIPDSDAVMDATWNDLGGWLAAHEQREAVVDELARRWTATIEKGGRVWVKEGGQSDLTADVVKKIKNDSPAVNPAERVIVVQHSQWNEDHTGFLALRYTKKNAAYVRIPDANPYLQVIGGDEDFERAAREHPRYGASWEAAFAYYDPAKLIDFSDSGELLYILGYEPMGLDEFRQRFLAD